MVSFTYNLLQFYAFTAVSIEVIQLNKIVKYYFRESSKESSRESSRKNRRSSKGDNPLPTKARDPRAMDNDPKNRPCKNTRSSLQGSTKKDPLKELKLEPKNSPINITNTVSKKGDLVLIDCYTKYKGVFAQTSNSYNNVGNKNVIFDIYYENFITTEDSEKNHENPVTINAEYDYGENSNLFLFQGFSNKENASTFKCSLSLNSTDSSDSKIIKFVQNLKTEIRGFDSDGSKFTLELLDLTIIDLLRKPFKLDVYSSEENILTQNEKVISLNVFYSKKKDELKIILKIYG